MIYSVYENVINNVDSVRDWLDELKGGSERAKRKQRKAQGHNNPFLSVFNNTPEDEETTVVHGDYRSVFLQTNFKFK